jgi:DNA-directed RNA polymerase subunit RPC12/RpoP
MPKIGTANTDTISNCTRCNSKRKITKTWTEKIENSSGFMTLKHTEYKCTNKECQAEFEKVIEAEALKREKLKQLKIDDAAKRASIKIAS